jgi:hypothetical protein
VQNEALRGDVKDLPVRRHVPRGPDLTLDLVNGVGALDLDLDHFLGRNDLQSEGVRHCLLMSASRIFYIRAEFSAVSKDVDATELRSAEEDRRAVLGEADFHVGDVHVEGRGHVSAAPVIVQPPEDVVLEEVVACYAEAAQARHACECRLEVEAVVRVERAVVDVEAAQLRVCEPRDEQGFLGLEHDVVVPDEAVQAFADLGEQHGPDAPAARDGEALELVGEGRERHGNELELVAVESEAREVCHRGHLAQEGRVDGELAVVEVQGDDLVFGEAEEELHAVGEAVDVEYGVRNVHLLRLADAEAVEDDVYDLARVHEVAGARELVQVDAEAVHALEARGHALEGPDVIFVEAGEVARRVRRDHDDVLRAYV